MQSVPPDSFFCHISLIRHVKLDAGHKSRWKIASLIKKGRRLTGFFFVHAYQDAFQDKRKNDVSLHARILHAFLSKFEFSKNKSQIDAEGSRSIFAECVDQCLNSYGKDNFSLFFKQLINFMH
ncbi:uncharacterized protein LOC105430607 [Pogonomyrmex barbatus]|uniref:Uncharacterized protein LOC105430607 n=1 Tax=Pogonomyrmex barbatus TaxID=144034 RepID=A0A6I9XCA8_9HYME|nr:uncharacterized protein LOC105430607 [Pogonomyrmex barbatus]